MKITVLSSHTQSLLRFRMEMMQEFKNMGHTVVAVGNESEDDWRDKFIECGIKYKQIQLDRNGFNAFRDIKALVQLNRFMKQEMPDKVFTYQAKTIIYGSIAAKLNGITEIYPLIAGLGSVLRGEGIKNQIIKTILYVEYRVALRFSKKIFFQNEDDKNEFVNHRVVDGEKVVIINGSGVNLDIFRPTPLPLQPAFLFIGRLIRDKGIVEYLESCKVLKMKYPESRCLLVGPFDTNPSALKPEELKPYIDEGLNTTGNKTM